MNVVIKNSNGQRAEGILLAAGRYSMRIMFPGDGDVTELIYQYGQWTAGAESVDVEAMITDSPVELGFLHPETIYAGQALTAATPAN